jgi:opacity protein-like surface antigen
MSTVMKARSPVRSIVIAAVAAATTVALSSSNVCAQTSVQPAPAPSPAHIGVQGIASIGVDWPSASKSFEAVGLSTKPIEIGGAAQVTNIWRDLFAQVSFTRISDTGERAFIADDGTPVPLGIPLEMKATYIDASVGWKFAPTGESYERVTSYGGAGVGRVKLTEHSPFPQAGDDVDASATSYHVMGGVEVRLLSWLSVSGDLRYRWVPDLLGDGGVSQALKEDDFGGFHLGAGVRIGFGGRKAAPPTQPESTQVPPSEPTRAPGTVKTAPMGTILTSAPVYLRPDESREPLRTLEAGTSIRILREDREWIRIEFVDRLLGPRVGYVLRKYVHIPD